MLAHPKCACTHASLEQLSRLLARCGKRVRAQVAFVVPDGEAESWSRTGSRRFAESIPGVSVTCLSQSQALVFGAFTSGQVLVYQPSGRLVFAGGITSSRGHAGDNEGTDALESLLIGQELPRERTEVFGCEIRDEVIE